MVAMAGNLISFDIGQSQVKMVWYRGMTCKKAVAVALPDDMVSGGEITSMDAMGDFLRDAARKNGIPKGAAAITLPSSLVFTRNVEVPVMTDGQLQYNLPFEFKDYLEQEKRFYQFDYAVQKLIKDEQGDVKRMGLFTCATLKSTVEAYREMLHRAGFRLKVVIPEEAAYAALIAYKNQQMEKAVNACRQGLKKLQRATSEQAKQKAQSLAQQLAQLESWQPEQERCFVDLGNDAIRMLIYHGDVFVTRRSVDLGMRNFVQILAEHHGVDEHIARGYLAEDLQAIPGGEDCGELLSRISVEVMKAVNFYNYNNRAKTLQQIHLCGGGSALGQISQVITDATGLDTAPVQQLMGDHAGTIEQPWLFAKAVGCALQAQGVMA